MKKIPVAWLSLIHNPRRLAAALAGVTFAVLLMFIEVGFLNGVYDSQTNLLNVLDADLFIINREKEDLLPSLPFSRRRLEQAHAIPGVASASPLYLEEFRAVFRNFDPDYTSGINVLGYRLESSAILIPELEEHREELQLADTALADAGSRELFGRLERGVGAELNGRRLNIVGEFTLGPNFRTDGLLIMSDQNFFRYFPDRNTGLADPGRVEFGLLKLADGYDQDNVQAQLSRYLPADIIVLNRSEFIERIKRFWRELQPIGAVFGLGAAVGFLIGVAVCYQILYTDITDNLAQYATLKALGSQNEYIIRLVIQKAALLGVGGFIFGLILSMAIYDSLQSFSGIKMVLTPGRGVVIFLLSLGMCVMSGVVAVRRALRIDPAELF